MNVPQLCKLRDQKAPLCECRRGRTQLAKSRHRSALTIIELVVVMMIILILAGLVLGVSSYVQNKGARARAETEIAAMSAALESYKADNGIYPAHPNSTSGAHGLYQALTGDGTSDIGGTSNSTGTPASSGKAYMSLKPNMTKPNPPTASTHVVDPWRNDYGYSSPGTYNPTFDLWSTGTPSSSGSQNTDPVKFVKNW